ncbi:hypothetical protein HKX48_004715 [Thoreauomyces humboldtii]|nr:hypothetical protein HKX48_004715 [Thoreauomyces humboldtii]
MGLASKLAGAAVGGAQNQSYGQPSQSGNYNQQQQQQPVGGPYSQSGPAYNTSATPFAGGFAPPQSGAPAPYSQGGGQPYGQQTPGTAPYSQQQGQTSAPYGSQQPYGSTASTPAYGAPQAYGQQSQSGHYGAPQQSGYPGSGAAPYGSSQQPYGQYNAPGQYGATSQPQGQYGSQQQGAGASQGQYGYPQQQGASGPQGQYGYPQQGAAGPQGQYGAPQQGTGGDMAVSRSQPHPQAAQRAFPVIQAKLGFIVQSNHLEAFYPPQRLNEIADRISRTVDFDALTMHWKLQTAELAYDLATLALYDCVIYADDSGSMIAAENGERVDDLNLIVSKVAEITSLFDQDGISVRFMNSDQQGNNIRSEAQASQLVRAIKYMGTTPLGTQLDAKVIQPLVLAPVRSGNLPKPILVIVVTDGEPVGEARSKINTVISSCKQQLQGSRYGPTAVAFQFAQVGKDAGAQRFLAELDHDPQIGKLIDCTSYYELEQIEMSKKGVDLTPGMWLVKLMVGAVDPTYDEQD